MLINTVIANTFLSKQITYTMHRAYKYNLTHNNTFYIKYKFTAVQSKYVTF